MPFFAGARVLNRPHSITAEVEMPEEGVEGVLLAQGTAAGGFTVYVKDRRLHYTHNWVGRELLELTSDAEVSAGRHELRYELEPQRPPDPMKGHGAPAASSRRSMVSSSATETSRTRRRSRSTLER